MSERLYNSVFESILVRFHRLITRRQGLLARQLNRLYPTAYFAYKRFHDRNLIAAMKSLIKPGTLVLDIGANIGFFSFAATNADDSCTVLAFEPAPDNFHQFTALIAARHGHKRVFPYQIALSDSTGKTLLHLSDLAPTDHKLFPSRSSRAVEVAKIKLDDFMDQHREWQNIPVSFIKMDVQGAELLVLRGMQRVLKANAYPPILTEFAPADLASAGVTPAQFFDEFFSIGYQPHSIRTLAPLTVESLASTLHGAYTDVVMLSSL